MRKNALIGFLFCTCSVFAQDLSSAYKTTRTDLGQRYDASIISAKTFSFNFPIYDKQIDTSSHLMYFTVREKDGSGKFYKNNGNQFALDTKKDSIIWINDVRKFDIANIQDYLVMSSDVNSSRVNKKTGLEQLQYPGKLAYIDEKNKIGLTYDAAKGIEKKILKGVSIEDASAKFTTTVPCEFDWNEAIKINDSMVVISSSGLYGINLKSGATWSVTDVTGERNKQKLIQSIMNPNAFRVRQNSFLESENEDVITQMCSNILVEGSTLYFASKNNLYSINSLDGKVNWKIDISKFSTSKSALFMQNGKLYMLNLGVANFKDRQIVYGSPYLLQADPTSGTVNFNNPLPMFAYPVDFQIGSTDLVMAGKNNLYFINLSDGKFFNEIDVNELRYGNFQEFVNGDDYYVEKEGYFVPLNFINDNVIYFHSTHGKVYGVEGGRIQYEYHESELYRYDKGFGSYKLIKQKFKTYIVSGNFELVSVLDVEDPAVVVGNSLYYFAGRKLFVLKPESFKK